MDVSAVDATVKLPLWRDQLRLGVEIGFSRFGSDAEVSTGALTGAGLDSATWIVPLSGVLAFAQPIGDRLKLVLSGQGAAVLVDNTVALSGGGAEAEEQRERSWGPGAGGALALEWHLGPGAALFEARYLWIGAELESLRGNLSQLYLNLGYRFWFL